MSKPKVSPATPPVAAEALPGAAATTAAAPTPVAVVKPRTKPELEAMLANGTAKGPFDGSAIENQHGFKRLLTEHPTDAPLFLRDGADNTGKLVCYSLPAEDKVAVLRRSAGPSGAWMVVRTSDLHQTRFAPGEKPKGAKSSTKAMTPTVVDLSAIK